MENELTERLRRPRAQALSGRNIVALILKSIRRPTDNSIKLRYTPCRRLAHVAGTVFICEDDLPGLAFGCRLAALSYFARLGGNIGASAATQIAQGREESRQGPRCRQ